MNIFCVSVPCPETNTLSPQNSNTVMTSTTKLCGMKYLYMYTSLHYFVLFDVTFGRHRKYTII